MADNELGGENGRARRVHELKTWPPFWTHVANGSKTFEVRRDDRGFRPGDVLHLREWESITQHYTGRSVRRVVTYVLPGDGFGVEKGFVVLGLERV